MEFYGRPKSRYMAKIRFAGPFAELAKRKKLELSKFIRMFFVTSESKCFEDVTGTDWQIYGALLERHIPSFGLVFLFSNVSYEMSAWISSPWVALRLWGLFLYREQDWIFWNFLFISSGTEFWNFFFKWCNLFVETCIIHCFECEFINGAIFPLNNLKKKSSFFSRFLCVP